MRPQNAKFAEMLQQLLNSVKSLDRALRDGSLVKAVVTRHGEDIMEEQRIQLLEGKASDGRDIRPYYSEDLKPTGWFHSRQTAANYAAWKQSGISYPYSVERKPDAPNLYVNGRFHSELGVQFTGDGILIDGETGYARGIVAKYGLRTFGLMPERWRELFYQRGLFDELMAEITLILNGY